MGAHKLIGLEVLMDIDRIDELKASLLHKRIHLDVESAPHWFYLEGFATAIDEPFEIREAKARFKFYQKIPIKIHPGEGIVGQIDWNEPLITYVTDTHIREDVLQKIYASSMDDATKEKINQWVDRVRPYCFNPWPHMTDEEKAVQNSHLAPSTFFNGHIVPDFTSLLQKGFSGLMQDVFRNRQSRLTQVEDNFYTAMEITIQGLSHYISRYADLAERLLNDKAQGYDPEQLLEIIDNCRWIAWKPAKTYPQALQLAWFVMCFVDYDSFGRFDQYIYPFYLASQQQGMSELEALLWLRYTWIKIEECGAILNMTIGGRLPDGSSATNPLTYAVLQVTREMHFRSPNLSLRIRAGDPDELWHSAHQSISGGQGLPALYNDDLIVPMLVSLGYAEIEAMDFSLAGCSQVVLPGRSNFSCDVGCYNLLKALELALHNGYDVILRQQVGPHTGKIEEMATYDALKSAYDRQMRFMTRIGVAINNKDTFLRQQEGACVRSLLTMDCLERGKGIFHGGARFYAIENEACGITNSANALAAIQQLVFEEKVISLDGLVQILDRNWEGQETLRLRFLKKVKKFGNGSPAVDTIRSQISNDWYREIQQYPAILGGFHWPGEVVFIYHEWHGAFTAASADGRRNGEPLASSAGASSGTDTSGPTALLNSMISLPQEQCRTCCVLNLRFSKKIWLNEAYAVQDLIRTYFLKGGYQVQINLVSREDLLAARLNPDQYADLVVRVGGFSDYYVGLSEQLQDEIMRRTELEA